MVGIFMFALGSVMADGMESLPDGCVGEEGLLLWLGCWFMMWWLLRK